MTTINAVNGNANGGSISTMPPPSIAKESVSQTKAAIVINQNSTPARQFSPELAPFMPMMSIEQAIERRDMIVMATKRLMVEGIDYGKIPNCGDKPALLLPGAQKLCNLFGLTLKYTFGEKIEDWTGAQHNGEPFFYYQVRAEVYRGEFLLAEGIGACHSWESKYRWRKAERTCPACGKANIRKSREGGWYCWKKTDGCGAVFNAGDQAIESQETGRKPNPDVLDTVNTILKIAYKRCLTHATINGTSASEFFTQDIEDFAPEDMPVSQIVEDARKIDTGGHPLGTQAAADYVAARKLAGAATASAGRRYWANRGEMKRLFAAARETIGELLYLEIMKRFGVSTPDQFGLTETEKAMDCYEVLFDLAKKGAA